MNDEPRPTAHPLQWPIGRTRTAADKREEARFSTGRIETIGDKQIDRRRALSIADGAARLERELRRFGAHEVVISTNVEPTLNGRPRNTRATPPDPGVAVYFRLYGQPHCLACDKWTRVADNLAAIAKDVEAQRKRPHWGVVEEGQLFAHARLLAAVGQRKPWWEVLGVARTAPLAIIEARYRALITEAHPDRAGDAAGNRAAEINAAVDEARAIARTMATGGAR